MAITNGYQIIGHTNSRKNHFGFIKWKNKGSAVSDIKINLVNRHNLKSIQNRFEKIYKEIIKEVNKSFTLENLSVTGNSTQVLRRKNRKIKKGVFTSDKMNNY